LDQSGSLDFADECDQGHGVRRALPLTLGWGGGMVRLPAISLRRFPMRDRETTIQQLSYSELEIIAGGLNPQPLPPFVAHEQNWRILSPIFTGVAVTAVATAGLAVG
jgi:hypothetical protein